jgi:hypothetical protein
METIGKSKRYSIISCLKSNGIDPESDHGKEIALKLASKEFTISKIESLKVTKKLGEIFEIPDDRWTVPSLLDNVLSNKTFD